jgi:site-specific DNA-adenine methylase
MSKIKKRLSEGSSCLKDSFKSQKKEKDTVKKTVSLKISINKNKTKEKKKSEVEDDDIDLAWVKSAVQNNLYNTTGFFNEEGGFDPIISEQKTPGQNMNYQPYTSNLTIKEIDSDDFTPSLSGDL